jgi:radical SAM superfamily enzyme YgiQ (UPF0313 family)
MPRLLLITASSPEIRETRTPRVLNFQQITMPYLAARVPLGWSVAHIDEEAEPIDWNADADVVAITFHTPSAHHAYALAAHFKSRGACVALGGPHVTLVPEEAASHADAIFVGEAEGLWEDFLRDVQTGTHRPVYLHSKAPSLDGVPTSRQALFHRRDMTGGVLFATRGCPNRCDFCTISAMYGSQLRRRPVSEVAAEYASFRGKVIIFWDDNIAADMDYAKRLCDAIAPYRKWWSSQASVHAGHDDEFLSAAARSGCKQLFLGLESISQRSMAEVNKRFNKVSEYARVIDRLHSHGIAVQAGIVFGFDHDTPDVFDDTVEFLEDNGVQNATFNILTPFPGTPLFRRLDSERRIRTRDWRRYNSRDDVVFEPKLMSAAALLAGFQRANARFYSLRSVARRLSRSPVQLWWTLPLNLAYVHRWRRHVRQQPARCERWAENPSRS